MLEQVFYIIISDGKRELEFGPYITFTEAATILVDHCESLISSIWGSLPKKYQVLIAECTFIEGKKEIITIRVREDKTI